MRKHKTGGLLALAAAFTVWMGMEAAAYPYGPGFEGYDVNIYSDTTPNNPAYNNGWNGGVGPGYAGSNPMGSREELDEQIYSKGPGSEAAQRLLKEDADSYYIHSTYRGGTWQKQEDGSWKLLKEDGQPVSSQWAYVDGKTYLLDMYGTMLTGFQKVNGNWYYMNSTGAMQTGWLLKEGRYYFLNTDGSMAYGWVNTQGSWYYFGVTDGVMLTNAYTPDGRYVNAEGILIQ